MRALRGARLGCGALARPAQPLTCLRDFRAPAGAAVPALCSLVRAAGPSRAGAALAQAGPCPAGPRPPQQSDFVSALHTGVRRSLVQRQCKRSCAAVDTPPSTGSSRRAEGVHAARNLSAVQTVNKLPNTGAQASDAPSWEIKMLYDGDCPLCMREVNMLKRRDAGNDRIAFVDIASASYSPQDNAGISFEEVCSALGGPRAAHVIGRYSTVSGLRLDLCRRWAASMASFRMAKSLQMLRSSAAYTRRLAWAGFMQLQRSAPSTASQMCTRLTLLWNETPASSRVANAPVSTPQSSLRVSHMCHVQGVRRMGKIPPAHHSSTRSGDHFKRKEVVPIALQNVHGVS